MGVHIGRNKTAYGVGQPTVDIVPEPIVSTRAPAATDFAPIGTMWVNKSNDVVHILTKKVDGSATWTQISN